MSRNQNQNKRPQWTPPDSVAVQMNIRKKIIERPKAKYLQLRVFKKYRIGTSVEIEKNPTYSNQVFQHTDDFNMWMIIKAYFPVNTEVRKFPGLMKTPRDGGSYDRVGAKIPKKFHVEVETPRLWPPKVKEQLHKHVIKNIHQFMKSVYMDNKEAFYLLTDKNWDVVEDLPAQDKMEEVTLKKLRGGYDDVPF